MKKITIFCFLISFASISSVQAISIGLNPSSESINLGDMTTVDIVISGLQETPLDEIVSAFDLDISFNQNILSAKDPIAGAFFGDPDFDVLFSSDIVSTPGVIDLAVLSFLSDSELAALQTDSFVLATLAFTAIDSGSSSLGFILDSQFGIDIKGKNAAILNDIVSNTANIDVTVVPLPPTFLLFGSSIFILMSKKYWKNFSA
jgi:hypothetical protein